MSNYCKNCYELTEKLQAKEQECEQEKALKETYLTCYKAKHEDIEGALFKLKQTLIEIKEIAEEAKKDICNNCAWRNTDSCDPEYYTCGELIKILQKINEVLNGTNP